MAARTYLRGGRRKNLRAGSSGDLNGWSPRRTAGPDGRLETLGGEQKNPADEQRAAEALGRAHMWAGTVERPLERV